MHARYVATASGVIFLFWKTALQGSQKKLSSWTESLGFMVWDLEFGDTRGLALRIQDLGIRIWGSGVGLWAWEP